jgi:5-methylcytosine-specific restriction endonuclease McrA
MPSQRSIHDHWAETLAEQYGKFWIERTTDVCFACGTKGVVERCHILAVFDGGTHDIENLHLLCRECHIESEYLNGSFYWKWFKYKGPLNSASLKRQQSLIGFLSELCATGHELPPSYKDLVQLK